MPKVSQSDHLSSRAWWIAGIYALFATLWIYFSDHALQVLMRDPDKLIEWSVYKGIVFVLTTSILLLLLMRRFFGMLEASYLALLAKEEVRREHEMEIVRLNRLYAALSQVNQAIVWTRTREELLGKICQVLVEVGRFRLAWIGWQDPRGGSLVPVAESAAHADYTTNLQAFSGGGRKSSGPCGTALAEGRSHICNNLLDEISSDSFRGEMVRCGFQSSAAIPIRSHGRPRAVLSVYSDDAGSFSDGEITLLEEAAMNISFALDNIERAAQHREAEALARSERIFSESIINSLPGVLYLYDEQGRFLRWNQNFENVTGYSAAEIARMMPADFITPDDRQPVQAGIKDAFESGDSFVEASLLSKDGNTKPYFFTGRRVVFEQKACLVGVGIDMSLRREAERALRELNETLELEVSRRTGELQSALVRAESADRLKSAFLATMSHELRTPLNSILGFSGIMLQGLAGPINEEQVKQLGMVRGSARHLLALINDVLDLSKIEAGQVEFVNGPIDIADSVHHVTELVRPLAETKKLQLSCHVDPEIGEMTGDTRRVQQVLINLLNNAIKFTETGSVVLKVDALSHPERRIRFRIIDTGIGIKNEHLVKIFLPFRQVDVGLARQHEGTGLGLAICQRLASLMGGEITVTSEWSAGSEFTVIIPSTPPTN